MDESERLRRRVVELELDLEEARSDFSERMQEIRSHTVPLHTFLDALLKNEDEAWYDRDDRMEFFTVMIESVDRIKQLLDAPIESGNGRRWPFAFVMNWQPNVDLLELIRNIFGNCEPRKAKHELIFEFVPEHILIDADTDKLDLLIRPVVTNVIKNTPHGREISVSARIEPLSIGYPAGSVLVRFKNLGEGISKEDLCRIAGVDPAFTIRASTSPRPIVCPDFSDLSFTQRLIEVCGGHIWFVNNDEGEGFICNVRLPLKQPI
jgi:signal transduction histidine kinase